MIKKNLVMMGDTERDFHDFETRYRDDAGCRVVAFFTTKERHKPGRKYPAELAGKLYPHGIPICDKEELAELIRRHKLGKVTYSFSRHVANKKKLYVF
jgi:predicted GTPase